MTKIRTTIAAVLLLAAAGMTTAMAGLQLPTMKSLRYW